MGTIRRDRFALVSADYDRRVDVLYIARGERVPAEGEGIPGGIELDYAPADGSPCGATIIGFRRNGWPERLEQLTRVTAAHLSVGKKRLARRYELPLPQNKRARAHRVWDDTTDWAARLL
jgi:hypothetical protein